MKELLNDIQELNYFELKHYNGGNEFPELLGTSIVATVLFGYFGTLGYAYAYYNYYKD